MTTQHAEHFSPFSACTSKKSLKQYIPLMFGVCMRRNVCVPSLPFVPPLRSCLSPPSTTSLSVSPCLSPKLIRLFPRLWAGSCSCKLDPQRQRNAGGLQCWQVKDEHNPHTHARNRAGGVGVGEERGVKNRAREREKEEIRLRAVGENDVIIVTFRERGRGRAHRCVLPLERSAANATSPAGQSA